jgi:serine/threonine-protein kinase
MNGNDDDDRWLEIAGRILDGQPVAWDTMPGGRPTDDASADALRVIAEVADLHRAPTGEPGRRWGTLAIQEQIGHGTFGDVYRARDAALDRDVALKLVDHTPSAATPDEGRLLARVRHSNVVTVHGAAIHDGRYGIWMEFIRGRTLAAVVREHGPLPPAEVTAIGIDVCRALTAVHASGLPHGDIKPQNVMREEGGRIVVMDFGTGRVVTDGTAGERLAGTPLYLAPEVLSGAAPDVRADVYSVGVLLYYLLTGAHPVEGSTLDEVRAAHASGARTSMPSRRPETPRPLAAIIERATAVEPSARFERAADFEHALRESSAQRSRGFSRRRAALIGVSVLIAALAGGRRLLSVITGADVTGSGPIRAERSLIVPLEFRNVPKSLQIVGAPETIIVRVRGLSTMLDRLRPEEIVGVLDLSGATPESRLFSLGIERVHAPDGLEVLEVAPTSITVELDRGARRRVTVVPAFIGKPAPGFIVVQTSVTPATVEIIGPESLVRDILNVHTEPIPISGARADVRTTVRLDVRSSIVRLAQPQIVQVTVEIAPSSELTEQQLIDLAVHVRNHDGGLAIQLVPNVVRMNVRGTKALLLQLRPTDDVHFVDARALGPGQYDLISSSIASLGSWLPRSIHRG